MDTVTIVRNNYSIFRKTSCTIVNVMNIRRTRIIIDRNKFKNCLAGGVVGAIFNKECLCSIYSNIRTPSSHYKFLLESVVEAIPEAQTLSSLRPFI